MEIVIRCAKGIFDKGILVEGTGFSLFRWESGPELPSHTGQCKIASWWPLLSRRALTCKEGIPGGHSRGYPGPKLRSGPSKSWQKQSIRRGHPYPKAWTSTTLRDFQKLVSEKLWAEFSFPSTFQNPPSENPLSARSKSTDYLPRRFEMRCSLPGVIPQFRDLRRPSFFVRARVLHLAIQQ